MRHRIRAICTHNQCKTYKNLELCSYATFLRWADVQSAFHSLFEQWIKHKCKRKWNPSIDRINNKQGYIIGNMRFIECYKNIKNIS